MTSNTVTIKIGDAEILIDRRSLKLDLSALWIDSDGYVRLGKRKYLHRVIAETPPGMETDHRNRNTLDNRRCNLRVCTTAENQRNRPKQNNNSSGHKGVDFQKKCKSYRARIMKDKKSHYLGSYKKPGDAGAVYKRAAKQLHGEFAYREPKPRKKKQLPDNQ